MAKTTKWAIFACSIRAPRRRRKAGRKAQMVSVLISEHAREQGFSRESLRNGVLLHESEKKVDLMDRSTFAQDMILPYLSHEVVHFTF